MHEKLNKVRKENPNFDRELVNSFAKNMPDLLSILIDGCMYDNHIGSKDVAMLAEQFITDDKGEHIGFRWDYETVINTAKNYIDLNETEFYPTDLWVWANVKYGDMSHITTDTQTIIRYAIAELSDDDFPFYPASQRAYCWLKKHIENES
jgi:hypothetical protein